jgi:hypothetical protein
MAPLPATPATVAPPVAAPVKALVAAMPGEVADENNHETFISN